MLVETVKTQGDLDGFKEKESLFLLYFSADVWSVCGGVFPRLMELAEAYKIDLVKIDTAASKYIPGQYTVFVVPTVLIIYNGREMLRESKFIDFNNIDKNLDYIVEMENMYWYINI